MHVLSFQHLFEKGLAVASPLNVFMNVEVEHALGLDLNDSSCSVSDEKLLNTSFKKSDTLISLSLYVHRVAVGADFAEGRDH